MALSELLQFLAEAIKVYVQMLSSIEIAGMRVIDIFVFFAVLGMVLVTLALPSLNLCLRFLLTRRHMAVVE